MNKHRGSDFNQFLIEQGLTNTNQPMTPTPRTDAELEELSAEQYSDLDAYMRMTKHARELERALAAEREQVAVWKHEAKRLEAELETFDQTAILWWCEYQDLKAKARQP